MSELDPEMSSSSAGGTGRPAVGAATWARAPVVVDDLDQLRGPRSGLVVLPLHLEASTRAGFDLADPLRRQLAYEIVLQEAGGHEDLTAWLDRDALIALWPALYLPRTVRAAREEHHPVLRGRRASIDVPRPR